MMNQAEKTANQLREIFPQVFSQNAEIADGLAHAVGEAKRLQAINLEKRGLSEQDSQMQSFKSFLTSL